MTSPERQIALASAYHERIWEAVPEDLAPPPAYELRRDFALAHVRAAESVGDRPPRVLDIGCGDARLTHELADAGASVIGCDVAEEPLRRGRARHPELDLRLVPVDGPWPFEDSAFDLVWAGEVVEHVTDTLGFFSEVRRVLRSAGTLALSTPAHSRLSLLALVLSPSRHALDAHFDPRGEHVRFYTRSSLRALLCDLGFENVHVNARGLPLRGSQRLLLASARRARFIG